MIRSTYTYAVLEVSQAAYDEIKALLDAAGYENVFHQLDGHGVAIDMHGIALAVAAPTATRTAAPASTYASTAPTKGPKA